VTLKLCETSYNLQLHHISQRDMRTSSLRKISLTTIVMVLMVVATSMSRATLFSTSVPVAFGERIALDSEQTVTVTTNDIDQNNATDRQAR
jgi:hypothetical protein